MKKYVVHKGVLNYTELLELRKWCLEHERFSIAGKWQGHHFDGGTRRLSVYYKHEPSLEDYFIPDVTPDVLYKLRSLGMELSGMDLKFFHTYCMGNVEYAHAGSYVPLHLDDGILGKEHIRFNFLVSKPDFGGMPVIEGEPLDLEAGDAWSFPANKCQHSCEVVGGCVSRITVSNGFVGNWDA